MTDLYFEEGGSTRPPTPRGVVFDWVFDRDIREKMPDLIGFDFDPKPGFQGRIVGHGQVSHQRLKTVANFRGARPHALFIWDEKGLATRVYGLEMPEALADDIYRLMRGKWVKLDENRRVRLKEE